MRKLVSLVIPALLAACGGGGAADPGEPFARLVQGANSGTMVSLSNGSTVIYTRSGGSDMAYADPAGGEPEPLGNEPVLACVAPDGTLLWQREAPSIAEGRWTLHAAPDGTFWMFGRSPISLDIDGVMLDNEGFPDMVFGVRLDASGTVIGARILAIGNDLGPPVFTFGDDGSSAVALTLSGTAIFNANAPDRMQTSNTAGDLTVLRYDAAGRMLWRRRVQSDAQEVTPTAICVRPDGDVVFHCHYAFGSTTILWITDNSDSPRLEGDSAMIQLDSSGTVVNVYESPSADWTVNAIAPHKDGHVLCGRFLGTLDDANGEGNDVNATNSNPGFVMRCGGDGRPAWTVLQTPDGIARAEFAHVDADARGRILLAGIVEGSAVFSSTTSNFSYASEGRTNGMIMILDETGGATWIQMVRAPEWSSTGPARLLPGGDILVKGEAIDDFSLKGTPVDVSLAGNAVFLVRLPTE